MLFDILYSDLNDMVKHYQVKANNTDEANQLAQQFERTEAGSYVISVTLHTHRN